MLLSSSLYIQRHEVRRSFVLGFHNSRIAGKSLEEIDEIFGDVKIVHEEDVRFSEKTGVEAIETRDQRIMQGS